MQRAPAANRGLRSSWTEVLPRRERANAQETGSEVRLVRTIATMSPEHKGGGDEARSAVPAEDKRPWLCIQRVGGERSHPRDAGEDGGLP
jgi:hypothetical protein